MGTQETIVDQRPVDQAPIDPNVTVPRHVREAAERAEAFYKPDPATAEQLTPEQIAAQEQNQPAQQQQPQDQQPVQQLPQDQQPQDQQPQQRADLADENSDSWKQRFLSMQGRWKASQTQLGSMQEQMTQLGEELMRANEVIARGGQQPAQTQNQPHNKLITDQDRETYGDELIDVARRAGLEAVQPELEALRADNDRLKRSATTNAQRELKQSLTSAVPNWMQIQTTPEWVNWLRLPNVYTNQIRGQLLKAAYAAADAPKVIALFRDFVQEVNATGGTLPTTQRQEQQTNAPRAAAVALDTLAAPGRARPAGGDQNLPADKPLYTRGQISGFYRDVRRGVYAGREVEKNRLEQDIINAQAEGRVRN